MKTINKILNDTLKSRSGKWSRKSLTMFISFIISLALGVFIVVSDKLLDKTINPYAIQVFYGFLTLSGFTGTLTVYDKMKNNKKGEEQPKDEMI